MRIFVSAGEPSGDLHGANLVRALRRAQPDARIEGFGGERMAQAGCDLVYPLCSLAVMGLFPVLAHLPKFLGVLSKADRWFRHHRPDALVLIDYPGLHWWLARRARFHKIPVFYFVPPQIWAWASWRVNKMRKWVDHVLCSLPFEEPWYRERGVNAEYIGHPYFDQLYHQAVDEAFVANQRTRGGRIIGLLPGSRSQEVEMNGVTMVQAARRLAHQLPDARFLFACYKPKHEDRIRQLLKGTEHLPIEVHVGRTPEIIQLSEACVAVSGSVGLELLWACKPTVVVYRGSRLLAAVAKRLVKCKYASLVNLLADRELYPELLTTECPAEAVAEQVHHWLTHPFEAMRLSAELRALRDRVAQPGACERAARIVLSLAGHSEDRLRSAA